jgi:predicted transcriptional regulator
MKTTIMYKTFLSSERLKKYLTALMEKGLIKYIPAENKYTTTESGIKLLKAMKELQHLQAQGTNEMKKWD